MTDSEIQQLQPNHESELTNLPDEVKLKIFCYLSTFEILRNVAVVCKDFYRISKDTSLIKTIHLIGCNAPIRGNYESLYEILKHSKNR